MDLVRRLMILWSLSCFCSLCNAACPAGQLCAPAKWHTGTPTDYADTPDAQFARWLDYSTSIQYQTYTSYVSRGVCARPNTSQAQCPYRRFKGSAYQDNVVIISAVCPTGTLSTFTDASGATLCVGVGPNNCPPSGTTEGGANDLYQMTGTSMADMCLSLAGGAANEGCVWRSVGISSVGCMNGKCYAAGPFVATGASCDPMAISSGVPKPAAETPPSDALCVKQGKCPGAVNGTSVCVPCSSKSQSKVKSSAEAASSASSGVTTTSGKGTTETETTECTGGSCTTTKTKQTVGSDGSTSEQKTTTTEPISSFCKDNPAAEVCKGEEGSKWGGSCAGFTCDGDAVQCAQAQAAWKLTCGLDTEASDPSVQAGVAAVGAGDRPAGHPGNDADQVPIQLSQMLDSTSLFGSATDCPSDVSVTAMGKAIALPFSTLCPYLRMLGAAFMASCYLAAALIVFKG